MALVLASIWNVLTQSLGYIPAFGLREPTFGYYARVLKDPGFLSSVLVSLKISVWSAVISTVLGVLLSMALIQCGNSAAATFLPSVSPCWCPMQWRRCS